MDAIKALFKVTYNGKNITADISIHLLKLSYTDNVTGVADVLELQMEDTDGKWSDSWYPSKGALLNLELGYSGGSSFKPNSFEISTINLSGSREYGDVVSIKAVGAGVNKQLHTKRSHAHENKTLSEIVHTIAAKYGLSVVGDIASIAIGRVTQHREKDLTFLDRLASEYGYAFSVKGSKLTFMPLKTLEGLAKVASIDKTDCIDYEINDKGFDTYSQATIRSHNPNKNKVVQSTFSVDQVKNKDGVEFGYLKSAGTSLEVRTKTENEQQANAKSEAALHKANSLQQTANVKVPGNTRLLAGCNIELTGFGRNSGLWHILKSKHDADRNMSYVTEVELKRVVPASVSGSKKKPKVLKVKQSNYDVTSKANKDGVTFNYFQTK